MQKRIQKLVLRRDTLVRLRETQLTGIDGGAKSLQSCPQQCYGDPPSDLLLCG